MILTLSIVSPQWAQRYIGVWMNGIPTSYIVEVIFLGTLQARQKWQRLKKNTSSNAMLIWTIKNNNYWCSPLFRTCPTFVRTSVKQICVLFLPLHTVQGKFLTKISNCLTSLNFLIDRIPTVLSLCTFVFENRRGLFMLTVFRWLPL